MTESVRRQRATSIIRPAGLARKQHAMIFRVADSLRAPRGLALSDLHVAYPENREIVASLKPESTEDWLALAGDVGELFHDIESGAR